MSGTSPTKNWVRIKAKDLPQPTAEELARRDDAMTREPDTSDIPEITPEQFEEMARAKREHPAKQPPGRVTLELPFTIFEYFRSQGGDLNKTIANALRAFIIHRDLIDEAEDTQHAQDKKSKDEAA